MSSIAGIDIGSKCFELAIRSNGRAGKASTFQQTPTDFKKVARILRKKKTTLVVMEATGIYYMDLAVSLVEAGLTVAVINPLSSKRFAELKLSQIKTDAADAALLAEYGEVMKPEPWVPPKPEYLALKDIGRQLNRLTKDKAKAKNRLHALKSKTSPDILIDDLCESIEAYERRLRRLTDAALKLIQSDEDLAKAFDCIIVAKGVGQTTAIAVLAEFSVLPKDMKAKQVTRYCGLDVRISESGSSVRGASRISKAGNAYLRSAMFMPAMSASIHDPNARRFEERLIGNRKTKLQAKVAIMRKYLTGLWIAYKEGQPFESSKLFNFDS